MKNERKAFPLEVKEVDESGAFSGYLSVFGNVDSHRDVVMPGAFTKSLEEYESKGILPPVLWQHDSSQPIGPFTKMKEDQHGLYVEGRLLINDIPKAREAHALVKNKVISGMSIGYGTVKDDFDSQKRVRRLTELKLFEGSIVTFPSNTAANVEDVKQRFFTLRDGLPELKEFEKYLRESGFSKSVATAIASNGLGPLLQSESGGDEECLLNEVKSLIKNLES